MRDGKIWKKKRVSTQEKSDFAIADLKEQEKK